MSETRLRAFADEAARHVDLPDPAGLARRGRRLRVRRATGAGAAVLAVALVSGLVLQDRAPRHDEPQPATPERSAVTPYPGNQMQDIPAGTYELTPSRLLEDPSVLITLPDGWNSWEGPNRFDGHRPGDPTEGRYNETALQRSTWYAGILVVKLLGVTRERCLDVSTEYRFVEGYADTVDALTQVPGYRVVAGPEETTAFGHPATHLVQSSAGGGARCLAEAETYSSAANGTFGGLPRTDIWVVDVDGVPLTVFAGRSGAVPAQVRREQADAVASIEFVPAD